MSDSSGVRRRGCAAPDVMSPLAFEAKGLRVWLLCGAVPLVLSFDTVLGSPTVLGPSLARAARGLHDVVLFAMGVLLAWRVARGAKVFPGSLGGVAGVYLVASAASLLGLVGTPLFELAYFRVILTGLITWSLIVGVLQVELGSRTGRAALFLSLGLRALGFAGYRLYTLAVTPGDLPRITPFGHVNTSAGYLAVCLPVLVGLMLQARRLASRCALGSGIAIVAVVLVTTGSRGAILALVLGAVAASCLARGGRAAVAAVWVLALGLLLAPLSLSRRLSTVLTPSHATNVFRVQLWRNALDIASHNPVLGVGYGSLWYFYRPYLDGGADALPGGHAHNVILHALAETGAVGAVTLACLLSLTILRAWRWWQRERSWLALGIMSSLLVMAAHGVVDTVFREYHVQVFFWCIVALLLGKRSVDCEQDVPRRAA